MKRKVTIGLAALMVVVIMVLSLIGCSQPAPSPTVAPTTVPPKTSAPTTAAPSPAAVPPLKIRWAGVNPVGHFQTVYAEKAIEAAKTNSKGQISVDWFPSEQLIKGTEVFAAAAEGRVDTAAASLQYISGDIPLLEVTGLFGIWKSNDHIRAAMEPLREVLQPEFAKKGIYLLTINVGGGGSNVFSNVSIPYTPADIKGLKIRVSGKAMGRFIELADASPVFTTSPEVYTALQRKTVDGLVFAPGPFYSYKLQEVVKYGLKLSIAVPFISQIANLKWWQGLTDSQRKIIQDAVTQNLGIGALEFCFIDEEKAWTQLKKDLKIGEPAKEQADAWFKLGETANKEILKNPAIGTGAQKILDVIKKYER